MVQPHPSAHPNNMYSRRLKTEEYKNKRNAFLFVFLTIITILFIFFFGLPSVIKFAAFLTEINQSSTPVDINDTTPPPPPRLESLPVSTKEEKIEIKGSTEPGAKVTIFINNKEEELVSDSDGKFGITYSLIKGENFISAKSTDNSGNESQKSDIQKIILDTEPPELEIKKPSDGSEFYGSRQRQLVIEGITEENSKVQVNQRQVVVESNGEFTYTTTLQEGDNNFTVTTEDSAGNKTEKSFSVKFTP